MSTDSQTDSASSRRCLNCGAELQGPYCHRCGQSAATSRYTLRSATVESFAAALRFHEGLPRTLLALCTRPWAVVRDMVQGRRASYTGAVRLLVILTFFIMAVAAIFGVDLFGNISLTSDDSPLPNQLQAVSSIIDYVAHSVILQQFIIAIPLTLAAWVVYGIPTRRRYNLAEYFVAVVYFCCLSLFLEILILPFQGAEWLKGVVLAFQVVLAFVASMKAFHFGFWRAVKWFLLFALAFFAEIIILSFLLGLLVSVLYFNP